MMIWLLYAGAALFVVAHLWLSLRRNKGPEVVEATKRGSFTGPFALVVLASVGLMVAGWWMSSPAGDEIVYTPPAWGMHANNALMIIAFLLFGAAKGKSRIKLIVRHPQLSAVAVWGGAHLLANGELRSVVLFGSLAAWSVISMMVINQRGPWVKPEIHGWAGTIRNAVISLVIFMALFFGHEYIFLVSPYPG